MSQCAICGKQDETVFRYKVHLRSDFESPEDVCIEGYFGGGQPIPVVRVESHWHIDHICTDCAKYVWGLALYSEESYPEDYRYEPYPVKFYYCQGCEQYHLFPNVGTWSPDTNFPNLRAPRFIQVFTSGRGIKECNLPPYTTASFVPYCNHVVACSESFINGSLEVSMGTSTRTCEFCGRHMVDSWVADDFGSSLCYDCMDSTSTCEECGGRVHLSDIFNDENTGEQLCECCYDDRRTQSEEEERSNRSIQDYNYKPCPIFYEHCESDEKFNDEVITGFDKAYFGIELEIDQRRDDYDDYPADPEDIADDFVSDIHGFNERFYIKFDGSLNSGVEVVSHPHTYAAHYNLQAWETIMSKARRAGFTSHDVGTCGIHYHVNRSSLGSTRQERDDTAFKMVLLTEVLWVDFVKFSRRRGFSYCNKHNVWTKQDTFDKFKDKTRGNMSRHNAVNLCNTQTVEFRMCRGTLNYKTFIASLQFMYLLRVIALSLSSTAITNSTFDIFIEAADKVGFTEFLDYCKRRGFHHPLLETREDTIASDD